VQNELNNCLKTIRSGGTIIFPTDTIWGLGCDATNQDAVNKVFKLKNRNKQKPLLILLHDENRLFDYVKEVPDVAFDLIDHSNKPLTIIYPDAKNLPDGVFADDGSVAIRICKDGPCGDLLYKLRKPLVATSANISGENSPINFNDISDVLIKQVDAVCKIDYHNSILKPSQIIKLNSDGTFKIIRK
jgi:L-threonylcarbamoyladenylate synthase